MTVGDGTKPWRVIFAGDVVVTAADPGGRHFSFGRDCPRPLADLTPLRRFEFA
ncbi:MULTISPECIES: hypothetical protein [Mycolicibacter]|uniref:Uncharacterized protein n=2 Tax=Mycolicibacter TaxID=1073531 RepID=A0ABU5XMC6_9MYCO|nr:MULTISPECIES: hypothetical protein [unclassified Mycolicibacter]MEB3023422.1 hypothetical protein [Mycolicibacter sp. MYC098]MEB3033764.1 hypothetical protein [Mycolicibacter sp. MYC340]